MKQKMMPTLKCGRGDIPLTLPENWETRILEPKHPPHRPLEEALATALSSPVGEKPLQEWLPGGDILLIIPDTTRYMGAEFLLPLLCDSYLRNCNLEIIFALGNHRKQTEAEKRSIVSDQVYEKVPCLDHDCFDASGLASLGRTPSGLEIRVNSTLLKKKGAILLGSISFHYLAGYGGGRKALFPGISGYDTLLGVHKKVFLPDRPGKHPRVRPGILDGNPMHEELMAALALAPVPLFLINTVVDDEKHFLNLFAGDVKEAHRAGCDWYGAHFGVEVNEKADVVVVSAGGYPKDIDFIQTHKALDHAQAAVKDGGSIILIGKCEDGIGNPYFLPWFDYPTAEEMEPFVRESDKVYAQTAYATRLKAERFKVLFVSDLNDKDVQRMGMIPKKSLADAVSSVDAGPGTLCYVIPEGSKTLIF
jgi:nickel-dependent lactate racemase